MNFMKKSSPTKGRFRPRPVIVVVILLAAWFSGSVGWLVRTIAVKFAPREGREFRIDSIGPEILPDPSTGVVLRVEARRVTALAHEALGWKAYAIPPRLLPDRMAVAGSVRVQLADEASEVWLPFVVQIQPDTPHPELRARLPSGMVNEALLYEDSFAHKDKRKDYSLGHYNLIHSLRFDTVTLHSAYNGKGPVTFRKIRGHATGQVRFKLEENLFTARTTAKIRGMDLKCDLDFKRYVDGIALSYKISIPKLDANIRNLAPIFEKAPVEAIRKALEQSIARPKKLERMARRRLPHYIPLDTDLDLEVFNAP